MTQLLVVEPSAIDPLGPLGGWLRDAGAELRVVRPHAGDAVPADLGDARGLVVLGGEMDADDDAGHPFLADVRALLARAVSERTPTLAVCLGAQMLALATGGVTRRMPDGPEAGFRLVAKRDAAANDPLLATLPFTPDVVQFHHDEVLVLPAGAELLAVSPHCTNQAFRVGRCAWGLQFHVETDPALLRSWIDGDPVAAARVPTAQHEPGAIEELHVDLAETWAPVAARFVEIAAAGPPPGELPLLGTP